MYGFSVLLFGLGLVVDSVAATRFGAEVMLCYAPSSDITRRQVMLRAVTSRGQEANATERGTYNE
jgi:hypothetical protein